MWGARQKVRCQQFSVRSYGSSPGCAAMLHLLGWSVSCLMPFLFPLSIWVDWTRVSHCSVSGLLVLLHFWAFCQGMKLFWSLLCRMITVRSPTHALGLLLFPWYDVAISKKHCFLRKITIQLLKKKVVTAGNWHLGEGCIYFCTCGMGCQESLLCCFPEGDTKQLKTWISVFLWRVHLLLSKLSIATQI